MEEDGHEECKWPLGKQTVGKAARALLGPGVSCPAQGEQEVPEALLSQPCLCTAHTLNGTLGRTDRGQKYKSRSNISEGEIINCNLITQSL